MSSSDEGAAPLRAVVVVHQADDPPGRIETWARARGIALDVVHPYAGDPLPPAGEHDFAVSLGADLSLTDDLPAWAQDELRWLPELDAARVPVLGVCFGGQALSHLFGGEVERSPEPEAGWIHMDGDTEPALPSGPWFTWHNDTFTVPPGGEELGRTEHGVQVFGLGSHLAVQFHPEVTDEMMRSWMREEGRRRELEARPGALERPSDGAPAPQAMADDLLDLFLRRAGLSG